MKEKQNMKKYKMSGNRRNSFELPLEVYEMWERPSKVKISVEYETLYMEPFRNEELNGSYSSKILAGRLIFVPEKCFQQLGIKKTDQLIGTLIENMLVFEKEPKKDDVWYVDETENYELPEEIYKNWGIPTKSVVSLEDGIVLSIKPYQGDVIQKSFQTVVIVTSNRKIKIPRDYLEKLNIRCGNLVKVEEAGKKLILWKKQQQK